MLPRPDLLDMEVPREVMLRLVDEAEASEFERVDLEAMLCEASDPSAPWKNEARERDFWILIVSIAA